MIGGVALRAVDRSILRIYVRYAAGSREPDERFDTMLDGE
jgi:hypothetical protein